MNEQFKTFRKVLYFRSAESESLQKLTNDLSVINNLKNQSANMLPAFLKGK